ncbi:hypothetical protein MTP10_29280 [Nonomuraea sp. 3-1Str]|uniref:hypothetical protein n=1 Tax=Nonomuraea sp. 3-1Str TaxID=2929801 RepID=UPI002857C042|nr:hypothetical protein [Nonomuraea sp. 3-1Str]MDR8412810.1 hypothetical protein [Nonomuraea sp. 3-1Str]
MFLADCPARTTLNLVADTWSVVVVFGLGGGRQRYGELRDRIGGRAGHLNKDRTLPRQPKTKIREAGSGGRALLPGPYPPDLSR